jgi:RHS repeat-associated protein
MGRGTPGATASYGRFYIYDANNVIAEYNLNGVLLARYANSSAMLDDVIATKVTSQGATESLAATTGVYYYLKDGVGSVVGVTDSIGNDRAHFTYSTFGEIVGAGSGTIGASRAFASREFEPEIGLYYNRARSYDPSTGRFMQSDPIWPKSGLNPYTYAYNNPARFVDPTGLYTAQLGISGGFTGGIFTFNIGYGIAFDTQGNITTYYNYAGGAAAGAGWSGGVSVQASNADTVYDLAGPFNTTNIGAGAGISGTVDMFGGFGTHKQLVTGAGFTAGVGLNGSAAVTYSTTVIGAVANPFITSIHAAPPKFLSGDPTSPANTHQHAINNDGGGYGSSWGTSGGSSGGGGGCSGRNWEGNCWGSPTNSAMPEGYEPDVVFY